MQLSILKAKKIPSKEIIKNVVNKIINIYKKQKKDNTLLYTLYTYFLLFSPVLIALDRFIKISGTLLTGIPFILGILIIIQEKKHILKYSIITLLFMISVIINQDFINGFETFKPLIIFLISIDLCESKAFLDILKRIFIKFKKEILIILIIIVGLNLLMLILPFGYSTIDTETWGLDAYMGLYSSPHQAAYRLSALIVFIAYMYTIDNNKKILISIIGIITTILLLKTGARTPTIIGCFLIMFMLYSKRKELFEITKKYIIKYKTKAKIILPILIIIAIYLILNSAFIQKMVNLSAQTFDSGRAMLREAELNYFLKSNIKNILFGNSLNTIYTVNQLTIGARIWCHNDFMQILLQFGVLMLLVYMYSYIKFIKHQKKELNNKKTKIIFYIITILFLFVSFYNGLFFFPRFTIIIPLLYILIKENISEVKK